MLRYQPRAGDLVRAREALWRVMQVRAAEPAVRIVSLRGADDDNRWQQCTLLEPFDRFAPASSASTSAAPRIVSRRRWMRALGALLAASADVDADADACVSPTLADADVALLPYQLEPLLAILRGIAARVLIADAVGLGKTIQAALILRELTGRGLATRVLIVVPAGLRNQWQRELRVRVGLESEIVDATTLAARVRELPPDVNPWTCTHVSAGTRIIIVSLDFIKQDVVLHGLDTSVWDVLIVDEAHTLTIGTDRATATHRLAQHSRIVLLLTATPHAGSDAAFDALCRIGSTDADDPLAIFRRTRRTLGLPTARRVRVIRVALTAAERHVHDLLERYIARVEQEHRPGEPATLAMAVLRKRASSSAWSLARSLERRLALLLQSPACVGGSTQTTLPFDEEDEDEVPLASLSAPGLGSRRLEQAWLSALTQAARAAAGPRHESKLRALLRLLRRIKDRDREPALIYTEYRDTLTHIADALARAGFNTARLHGGLTREGREEALHRFATAEAQILLATDAAGEGLNLQHRCRLVINLELPWNPNRLEQRIGRVDRLGQSRTVHAIHLVSAGTSEEAILDTLGTRIDTITAALGDRPAVLRSPHTPNAPPEAETRDADTSTSDRVWPNLTTMAREAACTLERIRSLRAGSPSSPRDLMTTLDRRAPWVTITTRRARHRGPLANLGRGAIVIWRTRMHTVTWLTALHLPISQRVYEPDAVSDPSAGIAEARRLLDGIAHAAATRLAERERPWRERLARRDDAIAEALHASAATSPQQPLLFTDVAADIESRQPRLARPRAAPPPHVLPSTFTPTPASTTFEHTLALVLVIR